MTLSSHGKSASLSGHLQYQPFSAVSFVALNSPLPMRLLRNSRESLVMPQHFISNMRKVQESKPLVSDCPRDRCDLLQASRSSVEAPLAVFLGAFSQAGARLGLGLGQVARLRERQALREQRQDFETFERFERFERIEVA